MKLLIFVLLVSVIGGLIITLANRPLRKAKNAVVNRLNRSFEEEKKETGKDDNKGF